MKKRNRNTKKSPVPAIRNNDQEVLKNFEMELELIRNIPGSFYSEEGGVRTSL